MGILAASSAIADDKPELFGTWLLDASQSTFGTHSTPGSMTVTITKKGKMVHIFRKTTDGNDEKIVENDCRSDGKYHPVLGAEGGSILCKWQGNTLVTDRQWSDGQNHEHVLLTLAPDGATVTEQIHTEMPGSTNDATLVLKRQ